MSELTSLRKKLIKALEENSKISADEKAYLLEHIEMFDEEELEQLISNNTLLNV